MELEAIKKQKAREFGQPTTRTPADMAEPPVKTLNPKTKSTTIQLRYNTLHYTTLQTSIAAQHSAGDFTYTSVSDLIRSALQAYKDGMQLTELDVQGDKTQLGVRVSRDLKTFFNSFPDQMRSKITERAVRTFVRNEFK